MPIDFDKAREEKEAGYPRLEIDGVYETTYGICVKWCCPYIGFGQLVVWAGRDGKLHADTESMSDDFVLAVFRELVKHLVREG